VAMKLGLNMRNERTPLPAQRGEGGHRPGEG
jgi:hypothetical protein